LGYNPEKGYNWVKSIFNLHVKVKTFYLTFAIDF